jgi:hypothetical protein
MSGWLIVTGVTPTSVGLYIGSDNTVIPMAPCCKGAIASMRGTYGTYRCSCGKYTVETKTFIETINIGGAMFDAEVYENAMKMWVEFWTGLEDVSVNIDFGV